MSDIKNLNIKVFIGILVIISMILLIMVILLTNTPFSPLEMLKKIPMVITLDGVIVALFIKWGWKLTIFQNWLVPFPCLEGTWKGTVQTTWKDPNGKIPEPIIVILVIKQSFLTTKCTMFSKEMTSGSCTSEFLLDHESDSKKIIYSYKSVPKTTIRDRSPIHHGTAFLDIITKPSIMLKGEYWTSRKTSGEINLKFDSKELSQHFPDDDID